MGALSSDHDTKLDEITSVIIVAEAGDEFPQHIVQSIVELPPNKRKLLTDVVGAMCNSISQHKCLMLLVSSGFAVFISADLVHPLWLQQACVRGRGTIQGPRVETHHVSHGVQHPLVYLSPPACYPGLQ